MKHLLKFAMGAALAGALVNMLMKKQAGRQSTGDTQGMGASGDNPSQSFDENLSSSASTLGSGSGSGEEGNTVTSDGYSDNVTPDQGGGARPQDWNSQRNGF